MTRAGTGGAARAAVEGSGALRVAVDIGGTFTDLVATDPDGRRLYYTKSLTTYDRLSRGVLDCIGKAALDLAHAGTFVHGSTIAINTVIQNTGATTGLITTRGFRDAYEIGRSNRPDAYNLNFERPSPLIPRELRIEVNERMSASGAVLEALDDASVRAAVRILRERGCVAIAVVLLHAYANPAHELRVREIVAEEHPGCHVSLSHEILREFREYERTSTTALNAYVAPIVSSYVEELDRALVQAGFRGLFLIMQSNGGTMSAEVAKARPAAMMESGPVAGVIGSGELGRAIDFPNVISFDMGGTTAKASLVVDGVARSVTGYHIGGYATGHPMMLPVVDIVEVGTGGGSVAWLDASGGLKVGPRSAGASPGPACYGAGGTQPTVTDANLVLGRLSADNFLGGEMHLDAAAARAAIRATVAEPLGLSIEAAALGILRIADTKMALAVREVSVAKGYDPRDFALVAQGGAGPLHAAAIARELAIPRVVVPELPGTFSALGMLFADVRHDYVQTFVAPLAQADPAALDRMFERMASEGRATLATEGVADDRVVIARAMDLRYQGQEYTLTVPVPAGRVDAALVAAVRGAFDDAHFTQYSHRAPQEGVEVVNLRLSAIGKIGADARSILTRRLNMERRPAAFTGKPRPVWFESGRVECPVLFRSDLEPGQTIDGPAVVEELVSTTVIYPGDRATVHRAGPLVIAVAER